MYAVMGVTGQVGGALAHGLLQSGQKVRAIVRDVKKAAVWQDRGCELALADVADAPALRRAFQGMDGVFVMLPPIFDPSPGFPEAREAIAALRESLKESRPGRVVILSTIGGHLRRPSLLNQLHLLEMFLGDIAMPTAVLRPAWFIENAAWDIAPARTTGLIDTYLQPLHHAFPMIGVRDVGRIAAELLVDGWDGHCVVEVEGPRRISPREIAETLGDLLGRSVVANPVPRDRWDAGFRALGMKNPLPRMQMLDGFNQGWIEFEGGPKASRKTATSLQEALRSLVEGQ